MLHDQFRHLSQSNIFCFLMLLFHTFNELSSSAQRINAVPLKVVFHQLHSSVIKFADSLLSFGFDVSFSFSRPLNQILDIIQLHFAFHKHLAEIFPVLIRFKQLVFIILLMHFSFILIFYLLKSNHILFQFSKMAIFFLFLFTEVSIYLILATIDPFFKRCNSLIVFLDVSISECPRNSQHSIFPFLSFLINLF